jgi:hypothetical protein
LWRNLPPLALPDALLARRRPLPTLVSAIDIRRRGHRWCRSVLRRSYTRASSITHVLISMCQRQIAHGVGGDGSTTSARASTCTRWRSSPVPRDARHARGCILEDPREHLDGHPARPWITQGCTVPLTLYILVLHEGEHRLAPTSSLARPRVRSGMDPRAPRPGPGSILFGRRVFTGLRQGATSVAPVSNMPCSRERSACLAGPSCSGRGSQ